jgi:hypothetical protein
MRAVALPRGVLAASPFFRGASRAFASCMRQVRIEGSRITMPRVPHRATNESQFAPESAAIFPGCLFYRSTTEHR